MLDLMTEQRALATVEEITELRPIEGADSIQVARVRGWDVIVRIGEFEVGDLVVYFEIDSFLPLSDPRFLFLAPRGCRKNPEGVEGHVLKTAKMRGVYSQGLVLPYRDFEEEILTVGRGMSYLGMDITGAIEGVEKWDPPIPAELAGFAKGAFPGTFRKTDEERIQNMPWLFEQSAAPELAGGWVATEKIDGSSMTVYIQDGEYGVASRNWDIEETSHNSMWKLAHELDLFGIMGNWAHAVDPSLPVAFQGEIFGPGIQGNPLDVKEVQFRLFTVQIAGSDIPRSMWPENVLALSVPVHNLPYPGTIEEALAQVENLKSLINPQRPVEGVVWRNTRAASFPNGARASWKAISQRYLLKHDR
ncbi:RNA ligase [Microbacterium phage A3Wally]|nr:RNA ligase [Microbacterium phage A3Wally]